MTADALSMKEVKLLIDAAKNEETPDGDPLTAARFYITAMEVLATVVNRYAEQLEHADQKRFVLQKARARLAIYLERATLLLQVANETGLLDKPGSGSGVHAALLAARRPPAQYNTTTLQEAPLRDPAVMGIPLDSNQGRQEGVSPPMSAYFTSDSAEVDPIPVGPPPDIDELLRTFISPKSR